MGPSENVIRQIRYNVEKGGYIKTHEGAEQLPADWECTRVRIFECKEGDCFKIRLVSDPDRNWPPDCQDHFEALYDWRGLRQVAKAWRGTTLVKDYGQCTLDEDMDLFDFPIDGPVELYATWRVPKGTVRGEIITTLGKMIVFHNAEVGRLREIFFNSVVPAGERARYRAKYGFDPAADRSYMWGAYGGEEIDLADGGPLDLYRYEAWLPLKNDPVLLEHGMKIGARTKVMIVRVGEDFLHKEEVPVPFNEVVFQHSDSGAVGIIWCDPEVVTQGTQEMDLTFTKDGSMYRVTGDAAWKHSRMGRAYEEGSEDQDRLYEIEEKVRACRKGDPRFAALRLPPWAHFAALKSFVIELANGGIEHFLLKAIMAAGTPGARWQLGNDPWPSRLVEAEESCVFSAIIHSNPTVPARFGRDVLIRLATQPKMD